MPGCLMCLSSTECQLCDVSYYLEGGYCLECGAALEGCFSCSSADVCTSCMGGYELMYDGRQCLVISLVTEDYNVNGDVSLLTYWES